MKLDKKIAIITGGSAGIGKAAVKLFAAEGAIVVIADIDKKGAEDAASTIVSTGGIAAPFKTDVTNEKSMITLINFVKEKYGQIDILFNNAGIDIPKPLTETSMDDFNIHIDINLKGVFLGCKHVIPPMIENGGGSIINVSSVLAIVAAANQAAYSASKGAVLALTRQIAYDYASYNIRVNCICPAATKTAMTEKWLAGCPDPEAALKQATDFIPLKRLAEPLEQASVAAFLASDESSFITGQAIIVDGGLSIW